jgi:hypothetical protein
MDGIMPTVMFFSYVTPILGACALMGFFLTYYVLQSQQRALLNLALTVAIGAGLLWYAFAPKGAGWLTHTAIGMLALTACFLAFVVGGHAADRKKQHREAGIGYMEGNWDFE